MANNAVLPSLQTRPQNRGKTSFGITPTVARAS